ncbi:PpiB Peptidyl-prolyl cis-trans isomerase (rotamase) - cyclophilin family [Candidatus Nanopelagicaceae bacterium]|jgi:peptidyl-prolyl cis-trans isomerase B (cyclophilin B)
MKKLLTVAAVVALASLSLTAPAQSAERATSVAGCAKSTAKGHVPAKVKQPTVAAKSPAKTLTFTTNCGDIVISLLGAKAPITVTSIATLANAGYYNKSLCHRLTTEGIYVLQCGDPTASGSGSPTGWTGYIDENLPKAAGINYPAGTVAMANSGPKTNGSQFFLVYKDTTLGPDYTIWGKITKGLDLVQKVGAVGAYQMSGTQAMYAGDGYPIQTVEIVKAKAK